jgi:hypothetical protein
MGDLMQIKPSIDRETINPPRFANGGCLPRIRREHKINILHCEQWLIGSRITFFNNFSA